MTTILDNQAAHRGCPPEGNPFAITDDMLVAAAKIDDLDEAVRSVMDQVGITDGGVAGLVFSGAYEAEWPTTSTEYRLAMLCEWRDCEQSLKGGLPPDPEGMNYDRAEWAEIAILEFQRVTGTDREDALGDLLANLMHWADRNGMDFDQMLERARSHYGEETRA